MRPLPKKHIASKSPDLNPVEKFWGWARKRLHKMDLVDISAGRVVPGQTAYKERIRRLLASPIAQQKARNFYGNLRIGELFISTTIVWYTPPRINIFEAAGGPSKMPTPIFLRVHAEPCMDCGGG